MFELFFYYLNQLDNIVWSYLSIPAILLLGFYLSHKSQWTQIFKLGRVIRVFFSFFSFHHPKTRGTHPLKVFFAGISGSIGISNIIGVCTAVQLGGPGAVVWLWVASLIGMIIKYAEIYLGLKYRITNQEGGYDGGPMYYLQKATSMRWIPYAAALLLCVYGADVYIFRTVIDAFVHNWGFNHYLSVLFFILCILIGIEKGVERVGNIASMIIPVFLIGFVSSSIYIFFMNSHLLLDTLSLVISSAFTGHAATGAFAGASVITTIAYGMKRACYAGDIGIGYAAVIHSESEEQNCARQASLGIISILIDAFIVSTISMFLILVTGVWNQGLPESTAMAAALGSAIPHMNYLWPIIIFLLGYSTLLTILTSGKKAAKFLSPSQGEWWYTMFAVFNFSLFSFFGTNQQMLQIMSLIGGLLLIINLYGMAVLVPHISFVLHEEEGNKQ